MVSSEVESGSIAETIAIDLFAVDIGLLSVIRSKEDLLNAGSNFKASQFPLYIHLPHRSGSLHDFHHSPPA